MSYVLLGVLRPVLVLQHVDSVSDCIINLGAVRRFIVYYAAAVFFLEKFVCITKQFDYGDSHAEATENEGPGK